MSIAKKLSTGINSMRADKTIMRGVPKRKTLKGSMEGYVSSKPAHLQLNGSGYSNPGVHQARYNPKSRMLKNTQPNYDIMSKGTSTRSTFSDGTMRGSKGGSATRLSATMRKNF